MIGIFLICINLVLWQLPAVNYKSAYFTISLFHYFNLRFQYLLFSYKHSIIRTMHSLLPSTDYVPNQVVFIRDFKDQLKPAKIIMKSSYGTYKIKLYGARDEQYANQYRIEPYTQKNAQLALGQTPKNNKKQLKFLKTAEKDHTEFQTNKTPALKFQRYCKQEEEDLGEQDGMNNQQRSSKTFQTKYDAILNTKVSTLLEDHKASKDTTLFFLSKNKEHSCGENPKELLIKKLMWALEDISYMRQNQATQRTIVEIMDSEVIEPVEYVTTSLHKKLFLAIEILHKLKQTKLKNYLQTKRTDIINGIENFLNNYTLFLRVKENFSKFLTGVSERVRIESIQENRQEQIDQ